MYHYVRVVSPRDRAVYALSVTPDDLGRQLRYLKDNGYTTLTMAQVDQVLLGTMPAPAKPVALTFDDGFIDFYTAAAPLFRQSGLTATDYIPTQMVGSGRPIYMTWEQVQELDRQGFEMAAHSQNHVDISRVNINRAKIEISGSKADLEQRLGHLVVDWAYPYGGYNAVVAALVQQAGFASATTTNPGAYHDAAQMLTLTRLRAGGGQSLEQFAASLKPPG
jgi:peptidoglycan/xylan/chitin deacetylase (PgdA/CDA1 family)